MENVVTVIFDVESEAYKAFTELRQAPFGKDFAVAEAALLKREGDVITMADAFDAADVTSDDTATGMLIGSIVGILGGPLGVLLGASTGALVGTLFDADDASDSLSALEVTAAKLFDGEIAIVALVQEEEPAFDVAFESYKTTIIRHYAVDVIDEVEAARDAEAVLANELREQLRAERKAEKAAKKEERKAAIKECFANAKAKRTERKNAVDEAQEIANAEFANATQKMMGR